MRLTGRKFGVVIEGTKEESRREIGRQENELKTE